MPSSPVLPQYDDALGQCRPLDPYPGRAFGKRSPLSENRAECSVTKRHRPSDRLHPSERLVSPRSRAREVAERAAAMEVAAWHEAAAAACEETDAGARAQEATMAATRARWHAEAVAAAVASRAAVAIAAPRAAFDAMHIDPPPASGAEPDEMAIS